MRARLPHAVLLCSPLLLLGCMSSELTIESEGLAAGDCWDGEDNDGDGLLDCEERYCADDPACIDLHLDAEIYCDDGVDEDADGRIDCDDIDCAEHPACTALCSNDCAYAFDGECDDGGAGSVHSLCELGTDCADCGPREQGEVCVSDCEGRQCGSDGCGGTCGDGCLEGERCEIDRCVADGCVPSCDGRTCGPDPVCGVSCGGCGEGESCDGDGQCVCVPHCGIAECGDDGCGGTCGAGCGPTEACAGGGCELAMRPYEGPTASARLIVGDALSPDTGRKVCLFGADDDRPFFVLEGRGQTAGAAVRVGADYVEVPAGMLLYASHHVTIGPDDTTASCDRGEASLLGTLDEGGFYTVVAHTYSILFSGCATQPSDPACAFYPENNGGEAALSCTGGGVYLFEDGRRDASGGYVGGYRVINLSANASRLSTSTAPEVWSTHHHPGLGLDEREYAPPADVATLRLCPDYLACVPSMDAADAVSDCTRGDSQWMLSEVDAPQLMDPARATTVYVFGNAGHLSADGTAIASANLALVFADDVSAAPLR